MNEILTFGILSFTSFISLINPLGIMPVFMTMTSEIDQKERVRTARKASVVAFIIILIFAFGGKFLFNFFGISIDSLRIVGGIIFLLLGMDMLQARLAKVKVKSSEIKSYVNDISVTPLAIPILCGPGAITNAIILMEDADSPGKQMALIIAIFVVILITFLSLYGSSRIIKVIGQTGINVMMRLMGLIVMVIAVEFFISGLDPIIDRLIN